MAAADNKVNDELDALKQDFGKLSRDVSALLSAFRELGGERASEARESLDEEVAKRRDEIIASLRQMKSRGETTAESIEEQVVSHPVRSVLLAFGVGFVLAKIMGGK